MSDWSWGWDWMGKLTPVSWTHFLPWRRRSPGARPAALGDLNPVRGPGPGISAAGMLGADIIIGTLDTVTTGLMCYCPGAPARWRVD